MYNLPELILVNSISFIQLLPGFSLEIKVINANRL